MLVGTRRENYDLSGARALSLRALRTFRVLPRALNVHGSEVVEGDGGNVNE